MKKKKKEEEEEQSGLIYQVQPNTRLDSESVTFCIMAFQFILLNNLYFNEPSCFSSSL